LLETDSSAAPPPWWWQSWRVSTPTREILRRFQRDLLSAQREVGLFPGSRVGLTQHMRTSRPAGDAPLLAREHATAPPAPTERRSPGSLWRRHPGVRSGDRLTLGERAADRLRNGMGSWTFVFVSLVFLAGWMVGNGRHGFDPYPFILLNLILSCLAALQGAILLIAAKREDQISSELAAHDYDTNVEANRVVHAILDLTREIHAHLGAPRPEPATPTVSAGAPPAERRR
jgi:uncharacterized membrane protein